MKILFGLVEPDACVLSAADEQADFGIFLDDKRVRFSSPLDAIKHGVGMVQQHFALAGPLTALDNVILGAEPVVDKLGIFVDRKVATKTLDQLSGRLLSVPWSEPVETLSVGHQQRLEILKLLFRKANILILDEPTAVLTPLEVGTFFSLLRNLRSEGKTIILITHKLHEVINLCDEVTVLRQGKVTGHFSTECLTREKIIHAMIGREIRQIKKDEPKPGVRLVEVKDLVVEKRERGALHSITFNVHKNEIVGIAGVEGNGQQALVESLLALTHYAGLIKYKEKHLPENTAAIRERLNFGVISEDRHEQSLWLDASIAENATIGFCNKLTRFGLLNSNAMGRHANKILKGYEVKMASNYQAVKFLSGGNQQKVVIAREITGRNPEFLIASQPTRGVDVGAIEFIHQQIINLKNNGAGILLVSSELEELCALSDRILVLFEGKIQAEFLGPHFNIDDIGAAMIGAAQMGALA
jgi:ABC-type uncharacterized transport system ATPase subunit